MADTTFISHFVVNYNHSTGRFEVDVATTSAHFPDGVIYNATDNEWVDDRSAENSPLVDMDNDAYDKLVEILSQANKSTV